jgi:TonB family protein
MLRQLPLLLILSLSFHATQTLGQTKCKGLTKGPARGGGGGGGGGGGNSATGSAAKIKAKPEPKYTKGALRHQVQGTVILRVVLHSSGRVRDLCVVQGLPYGLTKQAVEAAYRIKFEPAVKDGQPVSVTMLVQYDFSTY